MKMMPTLWGRATICVLDGKDLEGSTPVGKHFQWAHFQLSSASLLLKSCIFGSFLPSCILLSTVKRNQATSSTLSLDCPLLSIQFHLFTSSTFHKSTTTQVQFSQVPFHFITRIAFSPLSNNISLLPIWDVSEWPLPFIFLPTFCSWPLRNSLRRWLYSSSLPFSTVLLFSFWALIRITFIIPLLVI